MVKYHGKYVLEGLDEIPEDMLRDLDLAYDVCLTLQRSAKCECCGRCCRQPFITIMDEEVERVSESAGMELYDFVTECLYREDGRWLFRKDTACRFLDGSNRCTIWPKGPEVCRDFPYMVSKLMSAVYMAMKFPEYVLDLSYMEDDWPCTHGIKDSVGGLIEEARKKMSVL